jgi:Bax protein
MKKFLIMLFFIATTNLAFANSISSKEQFLERIYELIEDENTQILKEREFALNTIKNNFFDLLNDEELRNKLIYIKEKYKIDNLYSTVEYDKKINVIPPSLALAQAAVESAWGRSRFYKEANNIFGHWTYDKNNGLIPKNRDLGKKHLIKIFPSLRESVQAYMLNLNRNKAYKEFQEQRYIANLNSLKIDGLELSKTMNNYSGIAQKYLNILESVILSNSLEEFDNRFFSISSNDETQKELLLVTTL